MKKRNLGLFSLCTLVLLLPVTPASASTYTVVQGDSLYQIAKKHNTTTAEIMRLNQLASDRLQIGQSLIVNDQPNQTVVSAQSVDSNPPADFLPNAPTAKPTTLAAPKPAVEVVDGTKRLQVNADVLNVRSAPQLDSDILDKLGFGTLVEVLEPGPEWTKIVYQDKAAFVATAYLSEPQALSLPELDNDTEALEVLQQIISPLMNTRYVLGGTTPDGFDCSGFTTYVFRQLGVTLPRTSEEQFLSGEQVELEDAKPGDLLFYDSLKKGKVSHVAIYMGNGMIAHANGEKVTIGKMEYMHKLYPFYGVKRYVNFSEKKD